MSGDTEEDELKGAFEGILEHSQKQRVGDEEFKYLLDNISESLEMAEDDRETTRELVEENFESFEELTERVRELERENVKLEMKLERYQSTIPSPAYLAFVFGVLTVWFSLMINPDIVFLSIGGGLIFLSLVSVYESKVRMKRKR